MPESMWRDNLEFITDIKAEQESGILQSIVVLDVVFASRRANSRKLLTSEGLTLTRIYTNLYNDVSDLESRTQIRAKPRVT
ncbi:hypothetical protein Hypma_009906 [Hypsizygus marmoreus]|uniref:Uncharacterized protein n=1 Tax=Hypsizygus marmoreus TaxID=39966 RepID=A0A369JTD2_HYPMA|nr:hypothetical protein Hypma_009906 [Hypsizygus marmoreus]